MRDKLSLHEIGKRTGLSRNTIHTRIRELHEAGTAVARAHSSAAVQLVALYKALGGGWDMSSTINAPKGAVGPAPPWRVAPTCLQGHRHGALRNRGDNPLGDYFDGEHNRP